MGLRRGVVLRLVERYGVVPAVVTRDALDGHRHLGRNLHLAGQRTGTGDDRGNGTGSHGHTGVGAGGRDGTGC